MSTWAKAIKTYFITYPVRLYNVLRIFISLPILLGSTTYSIIFISLPILLGSTTYSVIFISLPIL